MPLLFPERLPAAAPDSERRVFEALAQGLDDRFLVFHSVAWHASRGKVDGEADFVIAHPDLGCLVLEVKGGGIAFEAGTGEWTSRDRHGEVHVIADPFSQALTARGTLVEEIRSDQRWPPGRWVAMGYAVVFPDIIVGPEGFTSRGSRSITLGKNDLPDFGEVIERVLEHWRAAHPGTAPGPEGIHAIRERYGRSWSHQIPLSDAMAAEEQRLIELTEQQMEALHVLSRQRRAAILGCAGSGKTLLAVEKARQLAASGNRVLLTCFNRALAEHWQRTLALPPLVTIRHFHGLCSDLVRETETKPPASVTADWSYQEWLPTGMFDALDRSERRFDAVVVDEGQDFKREWLEYLDLLLESSEDGVLYVFLDDNQRIYPHEGLPDWLGPPFVLTRNVRNTDQIGGIVRRLYTGEMRLSGVSGCPLILQVVPDDADGVPGVVIAVRAVLNGLRSADADPHDIVVLSGHRAKSAVLQQRRFGRWALRQRDEKDGDVLFETVHSFKGQDSPIIVLCELEDYRDSEEEPRLLETLLYVGCSRARTMLVVLGSPELLDRLEEPR